MSKKIGVIMDPFESIHAEKDSTLVLLKEAQRRGFDIYYMQSTDLSIENDEVYGQMQLVAIKDDYNNYYQILKTVTQSLSHLDILLMRKDPPVDMQYIYTTQLLEMAEKKGVKIINKPQSLRDVNEKLFIHWFPHCCPPTLTTASAEKIKQFLEQHKDIILKPLHGMGGMGIFRLKENDPNYHVIIETVTQEGQNFAMAQRYLPDIENGDKRIIMFHGEPLPYVIKRMAKPGETRANIAAGGSYQNATLTDHDKWICQQVGPVLKEKGLLFVGLDVIGDYLTEINVTSPTCLQQINKEFNINSAAVFFDKL